MNIRSTPCKHYSECGCEASICCLNCPLPVCRYDIGHGLQTIYAYQRRARVRQLMNTGYTADRIAQVTGMSLRAVYSLAAQNSASASLTDTTRRSILDTVAIAVGE